MKNNKKLISIIIPVLNGAETLEKCLLAILNQDFSDYEIIIVDNGSTDGTKEIITGFLKKSTKLIYIFESKRGRGRARNAGLAVASGEIIAMTDCDCLVPTNWLSKISEPILKNGESAVSGFEKDAVLNYWSSRRQQEDANSRKLKIAGAYIDCLDTKNFAIKTSLLKKLGFNPNLLANEDWDLFLRLKSEGFKIRFLPDLLVAHYHDATATELFMTQYARGYGAALVIKSYRRHNKFSSDNNFQTFFKNEENVKSLRFRNFLFFIPWALWQFIAAPSAAPYRIIADFSWKLGIIAAVISPKN